MTNIYRHLMALAVVLGLATSALAQATAVDRTTFSSAVNATQNTVTLAAASGAAAGGYLYVEGELMTLEANTSGTTWRVRRGLSNGATPARAHGTTATVWVGAAEEFGTFDLAGTCSQTTERYLPRFNTRENRIFDCAGNGYWLARTRTVPAASMVCGGAMRCREEFNGGHTIMQDDGTAKSLSDAEENFVYGSPLGAIEYREEQAKTASSWVTINGELDISADNTTNAEGVEIVFGASSDAALNQVLEVGTNGACIAAMITVADVSGIDELHIGFRQNEAFQDAVGYAGYDDWAVIGLVDNAGDLDAQDEEAGGGTQNDDTGITWADGERRALKVCISAAGVPTFYYTAASPDADEPIYIQATTTNTGDALTSGDGMVPFLAFLVGGTDGPNVTVQWVELTYAR